MTKYIIPILLLFSFNSVAQNTLEWSKDYKLQKSDFLAKQQGNGSTQKVLGSFYVTYEMGGFNLVTTRNLNKNVSCIFEKEESYFDIDDDAAVKTMLRYQRLMFDLYEIQARALRKTFFDERGRLLTKGPGPLREKVANEHAKLIADVEEETQYGHVSHQMNKWEQWTQNELEKLSEFCKTCKPKKKKK
ncbi:MAG: hypothetical protein R3182_06020 [Draconibacterium sp.]|nr:hypothetical protein [Draconibacterium sp.]